MSHSLTDEVPENIDSGVPGGDDPIIKKEEEGEEDGDNDGGAGGNQHKTTGGHTTINVTNRPEGGGKDDCSDITDNQEAEEQASRTFPQKLMDVLQNEEHNGIISFLEHGNGFMIHKKRVFAAEVLPKYFKASKFTSFTRKLNRWGFQRISRGPETGAYYHKLFRRDKPEYVLQMSSNSGSKYRAPAYQAPLLPNLQGGGLLPAGNPQAIFPFAAAPNMMGGGVPMQMQMPNLFPGAAAAGAMNFQQQQQQVLWQQQMQFMQFQMMQMQQQQTAMQAAMIQQQQMSQTQQGQGGGPQPQPPHAQGAAASAYGMVANPGAAASAAGPMMVPSLPTGMPGAATSTSAPQGMTHPQQQPQEQQPQEFHDAVQPPPAAAAALPEDSELSPLGAQIQRLESDDVASVSDVGGATNVNAV